MRNVNKMKENLRKCCKCGASPSEDASIMLYRFPKPGTTNSLRCELWAKYCFPTEEWSSPKFQGKLYSQHKMLCSNHFMETCFNNNKLFRTSAPSQEFEKESAANSKSPKSTTKRKERCGDDIEKMNNSIDYDTISNATPCNINCDDTYIDSNYTFIEKYHNKQNHENDVVDISMEDNHINTDEELEFLDETHPNEDELIHPNFSCNICQSEMKSFRYTCLQCLDWDMCAACEAKGEHPAHYVLRIPVPRTYADREAVVAAIREHIHKLLQMKNEMQEIYCKEEIMDEVAEELSSDVADPISDLSNRSVPELIPRVNNSSEGVVTESSRSNEDTIKTFISDELNTTESAYSIPNIYNSLTNRGRKIIIPISSSKTKLCQTITQSEVYEPVIKVQILGSELPLYKVIETKKTEELKPMKIVPKPTTVQIANIVDTSLFKNSEVKLPIKQLATRRPDSTPASKMSTFVPTHDSLSGRKVIILRKDKLHPVRLKLKTNADNIL